MPPEILPTKYSLSELPNKFATYFTSKISDIRSNFNSSMNEQTTQYSTLHNFFGSDSLSLSKFHDVSEDDFNFVISNLTNKTYRFDPAPITLLKKCSVTIYPVLHYIVSRSLSEGIFPDELKHATITPVIKNINSNPDELQNYRPISNTPYLAKILEKTAYYQINDYLLSNQLYSSNQSGFKQNHSCETA